MIPLLSARHSLVSRLVWITVAALFTSSLLIAFCAGVVVIEDSTQKGIEQLEAMNKRAMNQLSGELLVRKERLQRLADQLIDNQGISKPLAAQQKALDGKIWLHDVFNGGLLIIDPTGNVIADSPVYPNRVGINVQDRAHFKWVQEKRTPYISKLLIGRAVKEPVYAIISPILGKNGTFLGAVAGITLLKSDTLLQSIANISLPEQRAVYVLDLPQELIVTSSKADLNVASIIESLANSSVIPKLKLGQMSWVAQSHYGG